MDYLFLIYDPHHQYQELLAGKFCRELFKYTATFRDFFRPVIFKYVRSKWYA